MKITKEEKTEIKRHYSHLKLRFMPDGSVKAQKSLGGAWGLLYTPDQLKSHVEMIRAQKPRRKLAQFPTKPEAEKFRKRVVKEYGENNVKIVKSTKGYEVWLNGKKL